jgi:hypothetical protein
MQLTSFPLLPHLLELLMEHLYLPPRLLLEDLYMAPRLLLERLYLPC